MIKRYDIFTNGQEIVAESNKGEWAKWVDVEEFVSVCEGKLKGIEKELIDIRSDIKKKQVCNCVEMVNAIEDIDTTNIESTCREYCKLNYVQEWICPVHGYKKR